mgnify:FL=1
MTGYADRLETMKGSANIIHNLFNAMTDPDTISFGGGSPAKEALPVDIVRKISDEVMTKDGKGITALQYGDPYGYSELRDVVKDYLLAPKGIKAEREIGRASCRERV